MSANIRFISAGAGSGKTWSLTERLRRMLAAGEVAPAGVIATTFTRLAAAELQQRVRRALLAEGQAAIAQQMDQALIGTVNGVCGELLQRFAFEAGLPPDQQVLDEAQGELLFYQAMEQALAGEPAQLRRMNALSHRLRIVDQRSGQQSWRQEVKRIVDAARANNQGADDIRELGEASAAELLAHFPAACHEDLDAALLGAVNHALAGIDAGTDSTKATRDYLSRLQQTQAALIKRRLSWAEWIALAKARPGARSRDFSERVAAIACRYDEHPGLRRDLRDFCEQAFTIAAASLATYQDLKTRKGLIDFVDQEQRLYQLLDHPTVADTLREELQLLMVDEFQDTSPIQLALFLKLSTLAQQVIWVGDTKQSIYGFRGADPALMEAVLARVTADGSKPEVLTRSWRSRPSLVQYCNALFVPAFADQLESSQVALSPAREELLQDPAVELWRLGGRNKSGRAAALASGLAGLLDSDRRIVDKQSGAPRPLHAGDIAVLCRTHANLGEVASALADAGLPVRYQRPGLLHTPEGRLALACLRRLIDPLDTLASAEIVALSNCERPEHWLSQRLAYLAQPQASTYRWLEDQADGPLAALAAQRPRLALLTPVEALRVALDAGQVRRSAWCWGPTAQRSQHRLNNLSALLRHAGDYLDQCGARREPATSAGLVLWLQALAEAERDSQASGEHEDAIQLVTHHGAKGLEWPVVVAMDLSSELKPRLWGLTVAPSPEPLSLDQPLAQRRLRYWPAFFGNHSTGIPVLESIAASDSGQAAMAREIQEVKRLLYVSLTRPRDGLILTMDSEKNGGPWMDTLGAHWMLPEGDSLTLPDGSQLPTSVQSLAATELPSPASAWQPSWLPAHPPLHEPLPLRQNPSALPPLADAGIGEIIDLGTRLPLGRDCDPAQLGSALHASIACTLLGHGDEASHRILADHDLQDVLTVEAVSECSRRLLQLIEQRFRPSTIYPEHPVNYTAANGQLIKGQIDLLLDTADGFVIIDHKASPKPRGDWQQEALKHSGQLEAYAEGVRRATGRPVLGKWIHFGVTGGLVLLQDDFDGVPVSLQSMSP
ncbi:UvrD-helicase domain-containing protein [Kineobactrum salinum]|uniref:DNA 3'-5' helicase n=1 Tax=Kineobactrum salinum TaxID=2708301 RepID=A0A6C0U8Z0_9GAMM|nr:UvrD-helicase domain-containing protein [Kineobactrum salinum]QIB67045.1 UvrD-helicase domain-containing protein [Kineobactrum salinum]